MFDFFEPYKEPKKKPDLIIVLLRIAVVVFGTALLIAIGIEVFKIAKIKKSIDTMQEYIDSDATKDALAKHADALTEKAELQLQKTDYKLLNYISSHGHVVNEELFDKLSLNVSEGIYFNTIGITNREVNMSGYVSDLDTLANYEVILRNSGDFEDVFSESAAEENSVFITDPDDETLNSDINSYKFDIKMKFTTQALESANADIINIQ